ncbi:MAG: glycosyltransferase family 4 protein [Acidimicrobiales bacterium]
MKTGRGRGPGGTVGPAARVPPAGGGPAPGGRAAGETAPETAGDTAPGAPGAPGPPLAVSLDVSAVPEQPAGAGQYSIALVRTLARRSDVALTLVARTTDGSRWVELAPGARVEAVVPDPRPMRLLWEQARLPGLLAHLPVDVHHGPHYTMPETASLPRVVTIHDLTIFDHPEWHERSKVLYFRRAVRVAAAHADVLVCVSRTTARRLEALCGPVGEVLVVPHGVDHGRFHPGDGPPDGDGLGPLAALGIRQPYVAFLGTIEPRKDVPTLVRAFDRLCPAHPGLSLLLAGTPGWGEKDLEQAMSEARHPDRIVRLGYVPEAVVPDLLRRAAAVAYPALEEGFGLPVLEALACGSPLVTTSGTVMEEMADGAALMVEPGDADGLAGALDMLVRGDQGLAERRARGLTVAARYTWAASAAGHVQAYRAARERWSPSAERRLPWRPRTRASPPTR